MLFTELQRHFSMYLKTLSDKILADRDSPRTTVGAIDKRGIAYATEHGVQK